MFVNTYAVSHKIRTVAHIHLDMKIGDITLKRSRNTIRPHSESWRADLELEAVDVEGAIGSTWEIPIPLLDKLALVPVCVFHGRAKLSRPAIERQSKRNFFPVLYTNAPAERNAAVET